MSLVCDMLLHVNMT